MRRLLPILCLTLAVLFGSAGVSWSADFQKGWDAVKRDDFTTAFREWKPLAEQGNATAQYNLGMMHLWGWGVSKNYTTAIKWFRLALKQEHTDTQHQIEEIIFVAQSKIDSELLVSKRLRQREVVFKKGQRKTLLREQTTPTVTAKKPNPKVDRQQHLKLARRTQEALQVLGLYSGKLDSIIGVKTKSAIQGWQKRNGYPSTGEVTEAQLARLEQEAITRLAEKKSKPTVTAQKSPTQSSTDLQKGLDAYKNKDYAAALRELKPLAKQGDATAQYNLGRMYFAGQGVSGDDKTAYKWSKLAAEQGHAAAQYNLGILFALKRGIPKGRYNTLKTAAKWYRLAAEQGHAGAQNMMGVMYINGSGVPYDPKTHAQTAVKWFRLSAAQGNVDAQFSLGDVFEKGETFYSGIRINYNIAYKWFKRAAEQGDRRAHIKMFVNYASGITVPRDSVRAYMWATVAKSTELQDHVSRDMSLEESERAQKLASECVRKKYKGC